MATLNRLTLMGRLTSDADDPQQLGQQGSSVVRFRFASSKPGKKRADGGYDKDPDPMYIDCDIWFTADQQARQRMFCERALKGTELYLEGELKFEQWEDKKDGQKRSKHKLTVREFQFIGGQQQSNDVDPTAADLAGANSPAPQQQRGQANQGGYGNQQRGQQPQQQARNGDSQQRPQQSHQYNPVANGDDDDIPF